MSGSVARNTAFITMAFVGQKIISFVYFTLIARQIGALDTGKYFFALSFTTIFVVFIDLGLTQVLIREGARIKEKIQDYFSSIILVKILLAVLTYASTVIVINLLGYSVEIKHLVYLSAVTMVFDSIHLSIYGVLRAIGNLKYEAYGIVGSQLLTLILGSYFLYTGKPLIYLILAFTVPSFINVCFAGIILWRKYQIKLSPKIDWDVIRLFSKIALPFALAGIFARVYSYIDSILLSKLVGVVAVGWYSIAYKITFAFQFIPLALVASIYPRFSEYFSNDKGRLSILLERSTKYLLIIVLPIVVGISILAKDIVLSIYSTDYLNSILPLKILLISLIFSFISFPLGAFLNACNKQSTQTAIVFVVMVLNILLNLLLIPIFGVVGASVSALTGNILLTIFGYYFVSKISIVSYRSLLFTVSQLLLSVIVMGLTVWFVNSKFHYIIAIVAGAIVYPFMLFITKSITKSQIIEAFSLIKR